MSTSLIYHAFGARQYNYKKTEFFEGKILFHIQKKKQFSSCAVCSSKSVIQKGTKVRLIQTLPIGSKQVYLVVYLKRLKCLTCGALRQESLGSLADPKKHFTKALERYIVDLLGNATVKDVADSLGLSWNTVKDIHKSALKRRLKQKRLCHLRYIGVDEIAVRKGHSYFTVVVDLESGEVVWVSEGRKKSSLTPFLKKLKRSRAKIKGIAMDMSRAYISAVLEFYPSKVLVFDHYHIIADCNRMLDDLRRQVMQHAPRGDLKYYKGLRYLLLMGKEKIENSYQAWYRLQDALKMNETLNIGYYLKEKLRGLWMQRNRTQAEEYFEDWYYLAVNSGIKQIIKFAQKLWAYREYILNYFDHFISNARIEGINNKIKVLKRQAYGFRDMEYFKLRIYFIHFSRYSLIG